MTAETSRNHHSKLLLNTPPHEETAAVYEQITTSQMNMDGIYTTPAVTFPTTTTSNSKKEEQKQRACSKKKFCFLGTALAIFATGSIIFTAVLFREIATLKSSYDAELLDQQTKLDQLTNSLYQVLEQLTITSCADLPPSAPSGYYLLRSSSLHVYCDMSRTCGGVTGGWMRVFELDMTITSHQCPNGLSQRTDGGLCTCVRNVSAAGCSSIFLPTRNVNYSRVCGRITGYQIGTTNDFASGNIDSVYVDGVSLTHGLSQRQHIWTFAAALRTTDCPCQRNFRAPPPFVGNNYFCDSGSLQYPDNTFYSYPLWNDDDCVCCANPPWFHQQLPQPTSDDIEMRVCRDESDRSEDIAIQVAKIYVR